MFHLAHISDVHLSPLPNPSVTELLGKRLTGYINWKKKRKGTMGTKTLDAVMQSVEREKPHHLMLSGDIVNLSLDAEFEQAYKWISQKGDPHDISLTFGNHDAYVLGAFHKACKTFQPWITGDKKQSWSAPFPYMRVRDNIAIIAVSSALATPPFQASGYFGHTQAKHLEQLLLEAKALNLFRVVMIHHPPFYNATHFHKKLWGIQHFQNVIKHCGAELVLHGHTHLPTLNHIKTPYGVIPVVGVASASQAFGGHKPPANYNWFEIDQIKSQWKCRLKRYTIINNDNEIDCTQTIDLIE